MISEKSSKSFLDGFISFDGLDFIVLFDEQHFDLETHLYELKTRVEKRVNFLVETMEKGREIYQKKIQHYSERFANFYEKISREFQLINQQIEHFVNSKDPDPAKVGYLLDEMKEFRRTLRQRHAQMEKYSQQYPIYTTMNIDPFILGNLSLETSIDCLKFPIDDNNTDELNLSQEDEEEEEHLVENESIDSDETEQTIPELPQEEYDIPSPLPSLENLPNKKLLWSIHFKFVPQYISLYRQSILFASDRWGFVSTWTYTNARTKPVPKKSFVLFPQFRVGTWSRVYVESFSVCKFNRWDKIGVSSSENSLDKPYICVFVKGSDESLANFIAFFTHSGQLQMKVEYDHRYSLRQLICDESSKGNCICK